jgi:hypothetical protein
LQGRSSSQGRSQLVSSGIGIPLFGILVKSIIAKFEKKVKCRTEALTNLPHSALDTTI